MALFLHPPSAKGPARPPEPPRPWAWRASLISGENLASRNETTRLELGLRMAAMLRLWLSDRLAPHVAVQALFAARAWRRDRNAKRAAKLLDYYLERYPKGSLVEEALGLAIETNAARDALRRFESGTDH